MKLVRIFDPDDFLMTVHYEGEEYDEFNRLFHEWNDVEFLFDFFSANQHDLERDFWSDVSVDDAIMITRQESTDFLKHFKTLNGKTAQEVSDVFRELFRPLDNQHPTGSGFGKNKAYGLRKPSWLRIYALKIEDECFLITGGAIKLTETMNERSHTKNELTKLESCRRFLIDEGLVDKDGIIEFIEL